MRAAILLIALANFVPITSRAAEPGLAIFKPELFLMLPEPRAMGSSISKSHASSRNTVFTPARQSDDGHGICAYSPAEFAKLGISWETFLERAQTAADKRLTTMQPELKKDDAGQVLYAVYHSDDPSVAAIFVAPSLAQIFKKVFPVGIWLAVPNRNTLYVFPAEPDLVEPFAEDLKGQFEENAYAASDELFELKPSAAGLQVVASFKGH